MVVPDLINPVLPPMVRGIEETLWEAGLACLLADTDNRPAREAVAVEELQARRCEGLVIATATRTSPAVAALAESDVPTVLVTRETDDRTLPFVAGDDSYGVAAAVDHLVGLGHRDIVYLAGPTDLSTTIRREQAFRTALDRRLPGSEPVVLHGSGFTIPAGKHLTERLLAQDVAVTAILAGNDMMALGAFEALTEVGLRCPDDISVVGHNDMPLMAKVSPPLTTVSIPQYEVGVEAARLLLALRAGRPRRADRRVLPTTLVVRGSTARPPVRVSRLPTRQPSL